MDYTKKINFKSYTKNYVSLFPPSDMIMAKSRINILLPIALAIVIPGLGIYSNALGGLPILNALGLLQGWITGSIMLYSLWHALLMFWKLTGFPKILWLVCVNLVFATLQVIGYSAFSDYGPKIVTQFAITRTLLPSIIFLAIQYALDAQKNIGRLLLEKEQLQTENYRVRLTALRAQIDPHFMFNSLNTLRSMIRQKNENAEHFVLSLSDFYRHTLQHDSSTSLPLQEELEVLKSYLFLMKSRNEHSVCIDLHVDPQFYLYHLPTLALQVIVENCFKHNSMTTKKPLQIEIFTTNDAWVVVKNNLQPRIDPPTPSGLGLELVKKRYDLLGQKEGLHIIQTNEYYNAKLKLIKP